MDRLGQLAFYDKPVIFGGKILELILVKENFTTQAPKPEESFNT